MQLQTLFKCAWFFKPTVVQPNMPLVNNKNKCKVGLKEYALKALCEILLKKVRTRASVKPLLF